MRVIFAFAALILLPLGLGSCESVPGEPGVTPLKDLPGWGPHPTHARNFRVH